MNVQGRFRDGFPRLTLALPARDGDPLDVEFIVDTGFDGDLTLPADIVRRLSAFPDGQRSRQLADGSTTRCDVYRLSLDREEDDEDAAFGELEVLVINGNPLLGTQFLYDHLFLVEVTEGGDVSAEPL